MPKSTLKKSLVTMPFVGYTLRLASNILRLPHLQQSLREQIQANAQSLERLNKITVTENANVSSQIASLKKSIKASQLVLDNIQQSVDAIESMPAKAEGGKTKTTGLLADDHLLDKFYTAFEDKFRGAEDMIQERQKKYLPYFSKSKISFSKYPVLDLGSGRGEFISLLKAHKINALGLDINHDMVARSKKKGLHAVQGDALSHLQSVPSQTYGAITGFHIVEHIPFNALLRIFAAARRSLTSDGFVIFETPNPENVTVGSTTFYMDPSHLHPVPPALLAFTLEHVGFKDVQIVRLHPHEKHAASKASKDVTELLYGPRDYAVIAYK